MALALKDLSEIEDARILMGHSKADDAGILLIDDSMALVTTVDLLAPVVNDAYDFGYIAATNCLSDIYAMGGDPLVALNVVGWPTSKSPEILGEILKGSQDAVLKAGAVVLGGHTFQNAEIRYGLALTGRIDPQKIFANSTARPGDDLILTKPLGTGTVIMCDVSRGAAPEVAFRELLSSMKSTNDLAAKAMREIGANACTDITGFGFLGHSSEVAEASGVGIEIDMQKLPTLPMVPALIREGIIDGSNKMNMNSFRHAVRFEDETGGESEQTQIYKTMLFSSETSGGLLISVEPGSTEKMLARMRELGINQAAVVGSVVDDHIGVVVVK